MVFAALPDSRNCLQASMPLRIGIEMSETMRSGLRRFAASTSDWPLGTLPTISHVDSKRPSTIFRKGRWSSANRIRTFPNESAYRIRGAWKSPLLCTEECVGDIRFGYAANPGIFEPSCQKVGWIVSTITVAWEAPSVPKVLFADVSLSRWPELLDLLFRIGIPRPGMTQNRSVC
jgi:hypothetical protein